MALTGDREASGFDEVPLCATSCFSRALFFKVLKPCSLHPAEAQKMKVKKTK